MFLRTTVAVAALALVSSSAFAADLIIPTTPQPIIVTSSGFAWDGFYAGVQGGGIWSNNTGVSNSGSGILGAHVGYNYVVSAPFLVGVEASANYIWNSNNGGFVNQDVNYFDWSIAARAGAIVTDSVLVYAIAGTGGIAAFENNNSGNVAAYQLGGGVELAVADNVTIRGQVVGLGFYDDNGNDDFFDATKATVGVSYHF
jgi:outer membrane immunogenic protein